MFFGLCKIWAFVIVKMLKVWISLRMCKKCCTFVAFY